MRTDHPRHARRKGKSMFLSAPFHLLTIAYPFFLPLQLDPLLRDHEAEEHMVSLVPARKPPPIATDSNANFESPSTYSQNSVTPANGTAPSISYVNPEDPPPHDSGDDSDTPTPSRSKPRRVFPGSDDDFPSEKTFGPGSSNNGGQDTSHRKGKEQGKEKEKLPLGFLRSSSSILQPRLKLLGSPTSPITESAYPDTVHTLQTIPQFSENVVQVLKTLVVLIKVTFPPLRKIDH